MPSTTDAFEPQFDLEPPEGDDAWADNINNDSPPPPPQPAPKSKKKKGKKKAPRADDGDESSSYPSSYPKSVTSSPPVHHGVKLHVDSPVQGAAEGATNTPPLVDLNEEEQGTFAEDILLNNDEPPGDILVNNEEPIEPPKPREAPKPSPPHPPPGKSPRPAFARPLPPSSPPSRPISMYNPPRERQNSLSTRQPSRQESFVTHPSPRPRFVEPPPPHMPQQHFFQLPDLGFNFNQKQESGRPAGSDGYCCRLDSLADAGDEASAKKARDALLVGSEGGLEVFRVLATKLEVIGRLEGLGGAVIGAKILPHTERLDPLQELRPLVAVVVHGPMLENRGEKRVEDENGPPSHFQTTVDVYSLRTQHYVATLYRGVPTAIEHPVVGQISSLPDPAGDLHLDAAGRFITVGSGKSGEVLIFTAVPNCGLDEAHYRCIGKFWTSLQTSLPTTAVRSSGGSEATAVEGEPKEQPRVPVYSLSQRWLAILPPSSASNISIQGTPLLSDINPSPPGITTHAAPPQPLVTCEVVGTDPEGAWSRLGRQAAQGLVKYSQRGIEMGLQGWKELTHPSPPNGRQPHDRLSNKEEVFPPTKAFSDDPGRFAKEPALVSLIDLESLLIWEEHKPKYFPPPMATFALVEGCNYLSLSSTGTRLLTASRKGEVSTVWDLRQVARGVPLKNFRANHSSDDSDDVSTSPCIKQLQRIARNTPSTIIDCTWSRDDDAIALMTAHGTIHLHEIALQPAKRKRKRVMSQNLVNPTALPPATAADKADATVSLSTGLSPPSSNGGFLGSIKSSWATVSSQVQQGTVGIGIPTTFAGFRDATAAAGNAGSRALARGVRTGLVAARSGAVEYWHADDNKIRLKGVGGKGGVRWAKRNGSTHVSVVVGGTVFVHPVQKVERLRGGEIVRGLKAERGAAKIFPLPRIQVRGREVGGGDVCQGQGPHGFWSLRTPIGGDGEAGQGKAEVGADVETNPPYCPFHVDERVNIYAFEEDGNFEDWVSKGHGDEDSIWTFGDALPTRTKINERREYEYDDGMSEGLSDVERDHDEEVVDVMESRLTIQPASTSGGRGKSGKQQQDRVEEIRINTRRKKGRHGKDAEGGFDFLEDGDVM